MSIMNYLLFGVFWSIIMDLANSGIGKQEVTAQFKFGNLARFLAIVAWPIFVTIFLYHFTVGLIKSIKEMFFPLIALLFVLSSCSVDEISEDYFALGAPSVESSITNSGDIFNFFPVDDGYIQDVYLDTLQTVPYFKLFTEASKMKADYLYNGEHNVWGEYLSDQSYVETGSQFRLSTQATDYDLPQGKIYGRNIIGVRDNNAIRENQVITIHIEVYFDGYHSEYETVRIRLNPI